MVPEIASRKHIEKINQVIEKALSDAGITLQQVTAVAVTYGPGLVGALLVGVSCGKGHRLRCRQTVGGSPSYRRPYQR